MKTTIYEKKGRGSKNLSIKTIDTYLASLTQYEDSHDFNDGEFLFRKATEEVHESIVHNTSMAMEAYYAAVAGALCRKGMAQEEALFHISLHTWEDIDPDTLRQIVEAAYADCQDTVMTDTGNDIRKNEYRLIEFLKKRYAFRYNEVCWDMWSTVRIILQISSTCLLTRGCVTAWS